MSDRALPLLDLRDYHASGTRRTQFLHALRHAAREVGFFYLVGHGIDDAAQAAILQATKDFFALPPAAKEAVRMVKSPHFRGYTRAGDELTLGQADWREQFDVMREGQAPLQTDVARPWRCLEGPNQWPAELPAMKRTVLDWQDQLTELSTGLLRVFAELLGQDPHVLDHTVRQGPFQHLKLIRYVGQEVAGSAQGVGAHKDSGYLTLVLQDVEAGLEVLVDDEWVLARPVPGSFVVNVGELLELASDGYLKATLHRVTSPAPGRERYSCAYFLAAGLDSEVPLLKLPAAMRAQAHGPSSDPRNPLFREVGRNVLKGRLRSHPDVTLAHHAAWAAQV